MSRKTRSRKEEPDQQTNLEAQFPDTFDDQGEFVEFTDDQIACDELEAVGVYL